MLWNRMYRDSGDGLIAWGGGFQDRREFDAAERAVKQH